MEEKEKIINIDEPKETATEVSSGMSLYELNKIAYMKIPFISKDRLESEIRLVLANYFKETNCMYYMLLCKEKDDYTIFNLSSYHIGSRIASRIATDVFECMSNRNLGILDLFVNDDGAIEIWVKEREEGAIPAVYYMFDYTVGVIDDYDNEVIS